MVGLGEGFTVSLIARHPDELAVVAVVPAVIDAHEPAGVALALGADHGAAMPAGVEQAMELALLVAAEDHRPAGDLARAKIARILQFGSVSDVDPAAAENARHFLAQDFFRDQDFAVEQKGFSLAVVDDVGAGRHCSSVGSGRRELKPDRVFCSPELSG